MARTMAEKKKLLEMVRREKQQRKAERARIRQEREAKRQSKAPVGASGAGARSASAEKVSAERTQTGGPKLQSTKASAVSAASRKTPSPTPDSQLKIDAMKEVDQDVFAKLVKQKEEFAEAIASSNFERANQALSAIEQFPIDVKLLLVRPIVDIPLVMVLTLLGV